jgi:hypothetical protein
MPNRDELYNDLETGVQLALDGRQSIMWTALPGIVKAVDLLKMTVSVQPTIQGTVELPSGETQSVDLPLLINVPICFPKAGGFVLTLPIAVGDEVLVVFSSRCIDSWWQNGGVGRPMESRMHDLSDGFCIPGPCSVPNVVANISSTGAQLRNTTGTTYVEISADGKIKIVSATEIDLTGPTKITGNVNITGTVVATGEITANGTPLHTHVHGGVTTGAGSTGVPIP